MSSLSAQLAAISGNNSSNNIGSVAPTSKKHEESVGRGIHYSVQLGHSVAAGSSIKYQPTILYDTGKVASDIPLSTLWDNCYNSLQQLSKYPPISKKIGKYLHVCKDDLVPMSGSSNTSQDEQDDYDDDVDDNEDDDDDDDDDENNDDIVKNRKRKKHQKRTNAKRNKSTPSIAHLLVLLSSLFQEEAEEEKEEELSFRDCCLHVMEYLVRRYSIHQCSNNRVIEIWLLSMLPHMEECPKLFHRILQLIDLAALSSGYTTGGGGWLWLRPYTTDKNKSDEDNNDDNNNNKKANDSGMKLPTRNQFAQHIIMNKSVFYNLLHVTQSIANLSSRKNHFCRRGISQILSWSAVVIIQGLHYLRFRNNKQDHNDHNESILRTLLPNLLAACKDTTSNDYRGWSYIILSCLNETIAFGGTLLSEQIQQVILKNLAQGVTQVIRGNGSENNDHNNDTLSSALVTMMSVAMGNDTEQQLLLSWTIAPPYDIILTSQGGGGGAITLNHSTNHATMTIMKVIMKELFTSSSSSPSLLPSMVRLFDQALGDLYLTQGLDITSSLLVPALVFFVNRQHKAENNVVQQVSSLLIPLLIRNQKLNLFWRRKEAVLLGGEQQQQHRSGNSMASCYTSWLVYQYCCLREDTDDDKKKDKNKDSRCTMIQQIVKELCHHHSKQYNEGISRVVMNNNYHSGDHANDATIRTLSNDCLMELLHHANNDDDGNNKTGGDTAAVMIVSTEKKNTSAANENNNNNNSNEDDNKNNSSLLLPLQIAMEHRDVSIRLQAIERMETSLKAKHEAKGHQQITAMSMDTTNDDKTKDKKEEAEYYECLLQRFSVDDQESVVCAAGKVLSDYYASSLLQDNESNKKKILSNHRKKSTKMVLQALHKWIYRGMNDKNSSGDEKDDMTTKNAEIVSYCLLLAAPMTQTWLQQEETTTTNTTATTEQLLVEAIIACLDHSNKDIANAAMKAVSILMNDGNNNDKISSTDDRDRKEFLAFVLRIPIPNTNPNYTYNNGKSSSLWKSIKCLYNSNTADNNNHNKAKEMRIRRRCLWVLTRSMHDCIKKSSKKKSKQQQHPSLIALAQTAFDGCLSILSSSSSNHEHKKKRKKQSQTGRLTEEEMQFLQTCLKHCMRIIALHIPTSIPSVIASLVTASSSENEDVDNGGNDNNNQNDSNSSSKKRKRAGSKEGASATASLYSRIVKPLVRMICENVVVGEKQPVSVYTILMETALLLRQQQQDEDSRSNGATATERVLSLVLDYATAPSSSSTSHKKGMWLCIIPTLALLVEKSNSSAAASSSNDARIRRASIDLLACVGDYYNKQNVAKAKLSKGEGSDNNESKHDATMKLLMREIYSAVSENKSSIIMGAVGGNSSSSAFLSTLLTKVVSKPSSKGNCLKEHLLLLTAFTAVAYGGYKVPLVSSTTTFTAAAENAVNSCWLPLGRAPGGYKAAATVLHAMELAGEAAFPLSLRWNIAGGPLFRMLLQADNDASSTSATAVTSANSVDALMGGNDDNDEDTMTTKSKISVSLLALMDSVMRMLKGVKYGTKTNATMEAYPKSMYDAIVDVLYFPQKHGRTSSSSNSSVSIFPELCARVIDHVLSIDSWGRDVFRKLDDDKRNKIASGVLSLIVANNDEESESVGVLIKENSFYSLNLNCVDLNILFKKQCKQVKKKKKQLTGDDLVSISILCEYIRIHSRMLISPAANSSVKTSTPITDLSELLNSNFELLSTFSSFEINDALDLDDIDFIRQSILVAMLELLGGGGAEMDEEEVQGKKNSLQRPKTKELEDWTSLLLSLLGGGTRPKEREMSFRPLLSRQAKSVVLSIMTTLCHQYPTVVVNSLLPAMVSSIYSPSQQVELSNASSALDAIVPVYCRHAASANLSLAHLFGAFFASIEKLRLDDENKINLCKSLLNALIASPGAPASSAGAMVAFFLGSELFAAKDDESSLAQTSISSVTLEVLECAPALQRVSSILLLLEYANELMSNLRNDSDGRTSVANPGRESILPTTEALKLMAFNGPQMDSRKSSGSVRGGEENDTIIMKLTKEILLSANHSMQAEIVGRFIRRGGERKKSGSALCLELWQDLLVLQSTASKNNNILGDNKKMEIDKLWDTVHEIVSESIEFVQSQLPIHIFLASATTLITEGGTEELQSRAVRLIADRATQVQQRSPEAALFLDTIPMLTDLIVEKSDGTNDLATAANSSGSTALRQSALIAVEHIARALQVSTSEDNESKSNSSAEIEVFLVALDGCTNVLAKVCNDTQSVLFRGVKESASRELIASVALCVATLVKVTAPRCLYLLSKLVKPLVGCLNSANEFIGSENVDRDSKEYTNMANQARVMQLCVLRALTAIAETLPQFLVPYLPLLLSPSTLPSKSLRTAASGNQRNLPVTAATTFFEKVLSDRVPARMLIPAACKAISKCSDPLEYRSLLSLLKASVETTTSSSTSSGNHVAAHIGCLLKAITTAYEYGEVTSSNNTVDNSDDRFTVMNSANEVFLSLILKISEVQLRRLYTELREWRGDLDKLNPKKRALRRHAFWTISAMLSKELRAIFLPCLSSVVSDAVAELDQAVIHLCGQTFEEREKKKKKKKSSVLSNETITFDADCILSILPLMRCLESAFKADAHDGGRWIRADDGERYNSFVEPLGKLLKCRISEPYSSFPAGSIPEGKSVYQYVVNGVQSISSDEGSVVSCLVALAAAAGNEQQWKPLNRSVLDACSSEGRSEVRKAGLWCLYSLMKSLGEEYMVLLPECLPTLSELLEDSDEQIAGLAQDCVSMGETLLGESLEDSLR